MAVRPGYLADKSALARLRQPQVSAVLSPLVLAGDVRAAMRESLGDSSFEAAWQQGQAMSPQRLVEYALDDVESPRLSEPSADRESASPLSRREQEVAAIRDSTDGGQSGIR